MAEKQYLAVDLGAESGRVIRGTLGNEGIELAEIHRFSNGAVQTRGTLYWDILRLWNEIQTGISRAAEHGGDIRGLGIDTWGVDFGLLDRHGELLGNPVHYRDSRTNGMVDRFFQRISAERVYEITGSQTMAINTLFQMFSIRQKNPEIMKQADRALFIPDLLGYWLTGEMRTEYTIASTSQMLDAGRRQFSPEILAAADIKDSLFAPMIQPGSPVGPIRSPGAAFSHLNGVPVLAVGSHDTASAVAAVPANGEDWLFLSSGTWSLLGAEVKQPELSARARGYNLTNEGGLGSTIRLLKNIAGLWPLQECRRTWAAEGTAFDYRTLVQLARGEPSGTALLDLNDPQLVSTGEMPRKIAEHCRQRGLPAPQTPGRFTRVILESLAHSYAQVRGMLEDVTGRRFTRLHIVGGGSQNELLNQLTADATGMEVHAGPVEATALGNILAQALATGDIDSLAAGRRLVAKASRVQVYKPQN